MKKLSVVCLCLILCLLCGCAPEVFLLRDLVMSEESSTFYTLLPDNSAKIIITSLPDGEDSVIPDVVDGHPVTAIGTDPWRGDFLSNGAPASITIPDSVTQIDHPWIFSGCRDIRVSPDHPCFAVVDGILVSKKDMCLIYDPDAMTAEEYTVPAGIRGIGDYAFASCTGLKRITIPESVEKIGANPFIGCDQLEQIVISSFHPSLSLIDGVLFSTKDRRLIAFPAGVKTDTYAVPEGTRVIGESAFNECGAKAITIPDSVTSIGAYAFMGCSSLTDIRIPDGITVIEDGAFIACLNLTAVTIPDSVVRIGKAAFFLCSSLSDLTLPDGLTAIESRAFVGCSALKSVTIPAGVREIKDNPFAYCMPDAIDVSPDNSYFTVTDGMLFSKRDKRLICRAGSDGETVLTIPQGTRTISADAFGGDEGLISVIIPDSVTTIGEAAFSDCMSLVGITIPSGVTQIRNLTFTGCTDLLSVTIPSGIVSIGIVAFSGCDKLQSVMIQDGVTAIGVGAFQSCDALNRVTIPASVTSIGIGAFNDCSEDLIITVSRNSHAEQYCQENGLKYQYTDGM